MTIVLRWIFALLPLAIGILSLCLLCGWLKIWPGNLEFSKRWRNENRRVLLLCAIFSTFGGICAILYISGLIGLPVEKVGIAEPAATAQRT
jgi:hypothetical protein